MAEERICKSLSNFTQLAKLCPHAVVSDTAAIAVFIKVVDAMGTLMGAKLPFINFVSGLFFLLRLRRFSPLELETGGGETRRGPYLHRTDSNEPKFCEKREITEVGDEREQLCRVTKHNPQVL